MVDEYEKAVKTIVAEELKGNNPVPDLLGFLYLKNPKHSDFFAELEKYWDNLLEGNCKLSPILKIDVPKSNFTLRPMARPILEEWIIYETIIDKLSKVILKDDNICKRSYSILKYRNDKQKTISSWLEFNKHAKTFMREDYQYAVLTDITGYYENINLEELRNRLANYAPNDKYIEELLKVLFILLRKWSQERIQNYGLLQGPPASSFLADIFLDYVDRKMEKYDGYFRYMDDIRIFCQKEIEAKKALKDLIISLRELKLNINAKKTDILEGEEIDKKISVSHSELMTTIENLISKRDKRLISQNVIPSLQMIFEKAFEDDPFEKTHINFSLYRLGILKNSGFDIDEDRIIKLIINNFNEKPHHAGIFCNFLNIFQCDKNICNFLLKNIESENNIYEWQELKQLSCLLRIARKMSQDKIDFFLSSATDANKHFAVRALYFLLAGKFGSNRDRALITGHFKSTFEPEIKKAILLAVQELGIPSRSEFYNSAKKDDDRTMGTFIDYIKSLHNPLYYIDLESRKLETYGDLEPSEYI